VPAAAFGARLIEDQRAPQGDHSASVLPLDLAPGDRVYPRAMGRDGLLIGELASRSGVSRKALRLYERVGILAAPRRTAAGYRIYGREAVALVEFVRRARALGFRLGEIKEIVAIRRAGRAPCPHVLDLLGRRAKDIDRAVADLVAVRTQLRALLASWRSQPLANGVVCGRIENANRAKKRRNNHGTPEDVPVPGLRRVP